MSARDVAVAARNLLAVPELTEIVALDDYRVATSEGGESDLKPSNNDFVARYDGATGLTAGSSAAAGSVLVASATRGSRTMIAVVLGAEDPAGFAARLVDAGFASDPEETAGSERLPGVHITTLRGRLLALTALPRPLGMDVLRPGPSGPGAPVGERPAPPPARAAMEPDAGGGGGGIQAWQVVAVAMAAVLVGAVVHRRRRVARERQRRVASRRAFAQARRRGTLDVVEPDDVTEPGEVRIVRR